MTKRHFRANDLAQADKLAASTPRSTTRCRPTLTTKTSKPSTPTSVSPRAAISSTWRARSFAPPSSGRKPNGERLPAYRDSELPGLEYRLFSGRPVLSRPRESSSSPTASTISCANSAKTIRLVKQLLAGKSPHDRAEELVRGTQLENIAYRRQIYAGGEKALHTQHGSIARVGRHRRPRRPARAQNR